jgi:hypothetical protein
MEIALFVFAALVLWHFVYEGIVAPTFRMEKRYQLFELRDELRMAHIRGGDRFPKKHFEYMQDSLNGLIHHADRIDITAMIACQVQMGADKSFHERVLARVKWMNECPSEQVRNIRQRTVEVVDQLVAINNGAWAAFIVPVVLAIAGYKWLIDSARALTSLSERDLEKVAIPSAERRLVHARTAGS